MSDAAYGCGRWCSSPPRYRSSTSEPPRARRVGALLPAYDSTRLMPDGALTPSFDETRPLLYACVWLGGLALATGLMWRRTSGVPGDRRASHAVGSRQAAATR